MLPAGDAHEHSIRIFFFTVWGLDRNLFIVSKSELPQTDFGVSWCLWTR